MEYLKSILCDERTKMEFLKEFGRIQEINPENSFKCGLLEKNVKKNRYQTVLPYDSNRVVLNQLEDYINASWITVDAHGDRPNRYIASQGPLKHTVDDFWLLIWQEKITTIIMLTETVDAEGKEKCYPYWKDTEDSQIRTISIRCTHVEEDKILVVRRFLLYSTPENRQLEVVQYHFKRWRDMSVPEEHEFLSFYNHLENVTGPKDTPLIHCSAGIGRTGTFILIEIMTQLIKHNSEVDPLKTVANLRNQRMGMVETEDQLLFACSTVYNYFNSNNSA